MHACMYVCKVGMYDYSDHNNDNDDEYNTWW